MIVTKTPFRISFFGGGSDIEEYFNKYGGAVISTTIDKYVYVTVRHLPRFFDYSTEIKYSSTERVNDVDEIQHPMIRNAIKLMDMKDLFISYDADLPSKSGLGTSSTFAVGLTNAFELLKNKKLSKDDLARKAIYIERKLCNESGGWQDQIAAAYGGFNKITFANNNFKVTPIRISNYRKNKLNSCLLMYFTGFTRYSSEIQKNFNIKERKPIIDEMVKLVNESQKILENKRRNLDDFGRLLDKEWNLKRQVSDKVSNNEIDDLYELGIKNGALGGKLLGAGGGGFMIFYVPLKEQKKFRKAFSKYMEVPFSFDKKGSEAIYSRAEKLESY